MIDLLTGDALQVLKTLPDGHFHCCSTSPQTNGVCEHFHRTNKDEFCDIAFHKKLYRSVEEMQTDLDAWLARYNEQRQHSGRHCYGKTPM